MTDPNDQPMTVAEAVAAIDALTGGDPESAHAESDIIMARFVPAEVLDARARLIDRCDWWACA